MDNQNSGFGKIRSIIWPIHSFELKKFLPMSFLMFTILFVYSAVRDLKDIFIQSYAVSGGAELIAPLKSVFVFPTAILTVFLFSYLVDRYGMKTTFYIVVSSFIIFFILFAFFLFPNASKIHWNEETIEYFRRISPGFLYYVIPCIGNWSYSLFFVLAETWGSVMVSSFFWHFANQVTYESEVNRFYAFYSLFGSIGRLISGKYIEKLSNVNDNSAFDQNVRILISIAIFACVCTMLIYYYINMSVISKLKMNNLPKKRSVISPKKKFNFLKSIKLILSSRYLFFILMLSICYGVSINLFEGVLKGHMRDISKSPSNIGKIMGKISQSIALFNIMFTFISTYILRKFKWKYSVLVTPVILLSLGILFFSLMCSTKLQSDMMSAAMFSNFALWVGMAMDSFSKGAKFCLFDTTKGIAYRPLKPEEQAQGQSAVEILGGRGGKGLGAVITMMFTSILFPGSKILDHVAGFFIIFLLVLVIWIISCNQLGTLYEEKINENNKKCI